MVKTLAYQYRPLFHATDDSLGGSGGAGDDARLSVNNYLAKKDGGRKKKCI